MLQEYATLIIITVPCIVETEGYGLLGLKWLGMGEVKSEVNIDSNFSLSLTLYIHCILHINICYIN